MASLSDLLERVHDEFPAVPESLALRALSDAFKEFCSRTHIWQDTLPSISLREGVTAYELYPDDGVQIAALKDVRLDGARITPVATESIRTRARTPSAGSVTGFVQIRPDAIELVNAPSEAARLTVNAAFTLASGATEVELPDAIVDEFAEAIAAGAKMRLVRQAAQPWFSPEAQPLYAGPFYSAINTAKLRAMSALGEADMQIEMRTWA